MAILLLVQFFQLQQHGTTVKREILAGMTTFLTMAYILPVQPAMLSQDFAGNPTGLPADAVLLATCLAAAGATLWDSTPGIPLPWLRAWDRTCFSFPSSWP